MRKCVLTILCSFSLLSAVHASAPGMFSIDAKCTVLVPDSVLLNVPFEVIFEFEILESLHVDPNRSDTAILRSPGNSVHMAGDTIWTGHLNVGEVKRLAATYKFVKKKACRFKGKLVTLGGTAQVLELNDPKSGFVRHTNGASSRVLFLKSEQSRRIPLLVVTDSGYHVDSNGIEPLGPIVYGIAESSHVAPQYSQGRPETVSSLIKVTFANDDFDTLRATYYPQGEYTFVLDRPSRPVRLVLLSGNASFKSKSPTRGIFELSSDTAIFKVLVGQSEYTLLLTRPN